MQLDVEIDFSIGARDYCGALEVQLDVAISFLDHQQGFTPPVVHDAGDLTRRFRLWHMSERGLVRVAANQNSGFAGCAIHFGAVLLFASGPGDIGKAL